MSSCSLRFIRPLAAAAFVFALASPHLPGQTAQLTGGQMPGVQYGVQYGVQSDRIAPHPDLSQGARLTGHLPPFVTPTNEAGSVPDTTQVAIELVLSRSPARQAAFDQVLADQQNPASPRFHHWLTPQQIGTLYGPTQADISAISAWLTSQGFRVETVSPSGLFIQASAPASAAAAALHVSFRKYIIPGELADASGQPAQPHLSASTEPTIPAAFASVISAISGLTELPIKPQHSLSFRTLPVNGNSPGQAAPSTFAQPQFDADKTNTTHFIAPADFAVIYDVAPVYSGGITGAAQKLAILGRSRVLPADITNFETFFSLPTALPNVIIPTGGIDPGLTGTGDQGEATLDVERVVATAPGLSPDLIVSLNSKTIDGLHLATQYNINTVLDPVESISFGGCEGNATNVTYWTTLFSQAAAEGIATYVSSGDSAASCGTAFTVPAAMQTAGINAICSSPYVTCVGGTEFNDAANAATYWSPANGTNRVSALGYIPEGTWNEPTTTTNNVTTFQVGGGGGGASQFVTKPTYQTGTGVPADSVRDVPDVSLASADHDGYFGCYAGPQGNGGTCVSGTNGLPFAVFSGTSAAAPGMAAIAALLNQKLGSVQGPINPLLYKLAANPANKVFHDATIASSGVTNCTVTVPSMCNNSTPSATALTGGLPGYTLTTGYDLATGLGSLDVANLLNVAALPPQTFTLTPTNAAQTVTSGSTIVNTLTVTPANGFTGTVSFICVVTATGGGAMTGGGVCSIPNATVTSATSVSTAATITATAYSTGCGGLLLLLFPLTRRRRRLSRAMTFMALLTASIVCLSGCGGSNSTARICIISGIAPGAYTVTATGMSTVAGNNIAVSTTYALTVQ